MAKTILVPLDRSPAAEVVVPLVAAAARGFGATVRLLHVAPVPQAQFNEEGRVVAYADQEMARVEEEGLEYLRAVELQCDGVPVASVVRFGDPVTEILREAEGSGADLIAVATKGRSGLGRVMLGSIAEQVFRKAEIPVLLMRPGSHGF